MKYIYHCNATVTGISSTFDGLLTWQNKICTLDDYRQVKEKIQELAGLSNKRSYNIVINSLSFLHTIDDVEVTP